MNLPQQLQQQLNYPALQLINANTGLPENEAAFDALGQATIILFLAGLYKATRIKENAVLIYSQQNAANLLNAIFINKDEAAITIAIYAKQAIDTVNMKLTETAIGFLKIVQQEIAGTATIKDDYLQTLLASQRHEILRLVPGNLKIGDLLNDNSLEDNTNKMEGPVSSLMHKIENAFSSGD